MGKGMKWRALTANISGDGPADRILVIQFDGDLRVLSGFDGQMLDVARLAEDCPLLKQQWIPAIGVFPCSVSPGYLTVQF